MAQRDIPAELRRMVLVEAGHRCAIPTCRVTTVHIAHIIQWSQVKAHTFENLIALCPNCHDLYDKKKQIDRKSMLTYKRNLGIVNYRYGEFERRLFSILANTGQTTFALGPGGDIQIANAVKDGFFEDMHIDGTDYTNTSGRGQTQFIFPMSFTYSVTDTGREFIKRFATGGELDESGPETS